MTRDEFLSMIPELRKHGVRSLHIRNSGEISVEFFSMLETGLEKDYTERIEVSKYAERAVDKPYVERGKVLAGEFAKQEQAEEAPTFNSDIDLALHPPADIFNPPAEPTP